MRSTISLATATALILVFLAALAQAAAPNRWAVEQPLAAYFEAETVRLRDACLAEIDSIDDWNAKRDEYRGQLLEMLGLDPLPERTDLKATVTGRVEREDFAVENLHFQSRPGLYVTANLYLPKDVEGPAPAVLYVCGHGATKIDGVSYGNKVTYQHHGAWLARNGYVCLTIDTLQLGEIEAIHHGTYRYDMWWWNNRGYTPAGVEAWNCVRALDYLQSRPEVDGERLGVTGRSGGGAYSWWIASIDDRIKAAAPVAGITDLENHVIDGTVEGHCDCMFFVNTYRWDYPTVAALVAPRALLLENSDTDRIFPLDGVIRTHEKTLKIYQLHDAAERFGLVITPGPHKDTQDLRVPAFRWFNKFLKDDDSLLTMPAEKFLEPAELKVFDELPEDQLNTTIHETFVAVAAEPEVPQDEAAWQEMRDGWMQSLRTKVFRGWPEEGRPLGLRQTASTQRGDLTVRRFSFSSQAHVALPLFVVQSKKAKATDQVVLHVLGAEDWPEWQALLTGDADSPVETGLDADATHVFAAPRGVGPTAFAGDAKKQIQIRRRFMLLGQTLDGMRVWDVRRAIQATRAMDDIKEASITLEADGVPAAMALCASLFEPPVEQLMLNDLPESHRDGPVLLNVRRYLDVPEVAAMARERSGVTLGGVSPERRPYLHEVAAKLGW